MEMEIYPTLVPYLSSSSHYIQVLLYLTLITSTLLYRYSPFFYINQHVEEVRPIENIIHHILPNPMAYANSDGLITAASLEPFEPLHWHGLHQLDAPSNP